MPEDAREEKEIDLRNCILMDTEGFNNWKESVRIRVKTANDTSNRSRYCLIFLSLVSSGFILALFSYFFSWNRDIAFQYFSNKSEVNIIRDGIIREWLSTQTYQVPILGIKIMASDIQIFGPIILLIVSTWLYYEVRREHFTVGRLLGDVYFTLKDLVAAKDTKAIIISQEVYHNLIGYTVLNVIPYDKNIDRLGDPLIPGKTILKKTLDLKIRRIVIRFLTFTPIISIVFIACTRILSFTVLHSAVTGKIHSFSNITGLRYILIIIALVIIIFALIFCYLNIKKVYRLEAATRRLLDEYQYWAFSGGSPNS